MVRNCRLKIECWISGYRETAERIITMKLGYLEFVEVLRKQLLNDGNAKDVLILHLGSLATLNDAILKGVAA